MQNENTDIKTILSQLKIAELNEMQLACIETMENPATSFYYL